MKRLYALLSAIMMAATIALPSHASANGFKITPVQDTLILKLKNNAKVLVVVKDLQDVKNLKSQSLDSLILLLEKHVDQIERAGKSAGENPVNITIDKTEGMGKDDVNITITQSTGDKKQIISKEIKNIRIDVDVENEVDKTTVAVNMQKDSTDTDDDDDEKEKEKYSKTYSEIQLDYGASRWANTGATPGLTSAKAHFRPIASRYFSINSKGYRRIGGSGSPLTISSGLSLEFHNYMFDDNQMLVNFGDKSGMVVSDRELEKSKLSTSSISIPVELSLDVKNQKHNTVFRIGGGGFVGYLIGSKTKIVYNEEGDSKTSKMRDDFHQNHLLYGVSAFVGTGDLDIFAKYNLNDVFDDDKGPKGNALALGLRWKL